MAIAVGKTAGKATQTGLFIAIGGLGLGVISTFVVLMIRFFG